MFNNEIRYMKNNSSAAFGFVSASTVEVNSLSDFLKNGYLYLLENVFFLDIKAIQIEKIIESMPSPIDITSEENICK